MREARERVEYDRKMINKKRASQGMALISPDTLASEIRTMTKKLFAEIEEKKTHFQRMEAASRKRMQEDREKIEAEEQVKKEQQKEWEHTRDKRVKSWKKFCDSRLNGRKKGKYEVRAPQVREERLDNPSKTGDGKPLGINEDYKKSWR